MLGSPPGHVKPTSSGHRGGVGAFINTVVPKFTHKIYIIFNFKKKAAIQILIFMYRHSGGEPIAVESFSQIIFSQTNPCGSGILCNSNQNKRLSGRVFLSLFLSFYFLVFFRKQKLTVAFARFMAFSPFPLSFYIYM